MISPKAVVIFASALSFLSLLGLAYGEPIFNVQGKVYCDTCRVQFVTRATKFMPDATVRLECRDRAEGNVTYSVQGVTNDKGIYSLPVEGEHEEELCEIVLTKSSMADCDEVPKDAGTKNAARVSLTDNNGLASTTRNANALGFLIKKPLSECEAVYKELGIKPGDIL